MNEDAAIQDLYRKIEREKAIIKGADQMRQATQNSQVNSRVDSQVRDAKRNLQYFEQTLHDLQKRKMGGDMGRMSLSGNGGPASPSRSAPGSSGGGMNNQQGYGYGERADYGAPGPGGYSGGGAPGQMPPRAPYAPPGPADRSPRARPNYSKLGMYDLSKELKVES